MLITERKPFWLTVLWIHFQETVIGLARAELTWHCQHFFSSTWSSKEERVLAARAEILLANVERSAPSKSAGTCCLPLLIIATYINILQLSCINCSLFLLKHVKSYSSFHHILPLQPPCSSDSQFPASVPKDRGWLDRKGKRGAVTRFWSKLAQFSPMMLRQEGNLNVSV